MIVLHGLGRMPSIGQGLHECMPICPIMVLLTFPKRKVSKTSTQVDLILLKTKDRPLCSF